MTNLQEGVSQKFQKGAETISGERLGRVSIGIERECDDVKIGLRRLGIQEDFNGETLLKPPKSYQAQNPYQLSVFEESVSGLFLAGG